MYADTDFWLALLKDDDWLADRAEEVLNEHGDELEVSLVTFVELFLVEERYSFDRERAVTSILELADYDGDKSTVYQASEYVDEGLNTFDAFHAALAGDAGNRIVSSDKEFDGVPLDRLALESE